MKTVTGVLAVLLAFAAQTACAKPAATETVAEGFVAWTGVTEKNHLAGRGLCPSDLRHKVTVVAALESDERLRDQLILLSKAMPQVGYDAPDGGVEKWIVPRAYVGLVSCRGRVTKEALKAALVAPANEKQEVAWAVSLVVGWGSGAYREASFEGAADPTGKCPYVTVLGPNGGEPLWQGTITEKTVPQARAAIDRARKELDKWETKWRPFYGNVAEPKFFPQLAKALEKGRTAKSCPLDPVAKALLADVASKDPARAREAQILYDAVNQTRDDLKLRISLEAAKYPHVALADMAELFKYWPGERKEMEGLSARLRADPDVELLAKLYPKVREWSAPDFRCRNAGEAKKVVAELNKMKKQIAKHKESSKIAIQNAALAMDLKLDTLIETIPSNVGGPLGN